MGINKYSRLKKISLTLGLLLALYAIGGYFLVPWIALPILEKEIDSQINGKVTIEALRINPFTLTVTAEGITLANTKREPLLVARSLFLNLAIRGLYERALTFQDIHLIEPQVILSKNDTGVLNFAGFIKDSPPHQTDESPQAGLGVVIDRLIISEGGLSYSDAQVQKHFEFELKPLKLELLNARSFPGGESLFELSARNTESNTLSLKGKLESSPFKITGNLDLNINEPGPIFQYLTRFLNVSSPDSKIHLVSDFVFDPSSEQTELAFNTSLLEISALELIDPIDASHIAMIKKLAFDIDFSLRERSAEISNLILDAGDLSIVKRADGGFNLSQFLAAETSEPTPRDPNLKPWQVTVSESKMRNFAIFYSDLTNRESNLSVRDLDINLDRISTSGRGSVAAKIQGLLGESGSIQTAVTGNFSPLDLTIDLKLRKLAINTLATALKLDFEPVIEKGSGSLDGLVRIKDGTPARVMVSANAEISDLMAQDVSSSNKSLAIESIEGTGINYQNDPPLLTIDQITIRKPEVSLKVNKEGQNNFYRIKTGNKEDSKSLQSSPKLSFKLRGLALDSGVFLYRDESLPSPFKTKISQINATFSDITNNSQLQFKLDLKAKIDSQGELSYKGNVFPLSSFPLQNGELNLRDVTMLSFSPYTSKFLGRTVEGGKIHAEIKSRTEGDLLFGENNFVLDRFYLGDQTGSSATNIPVSSALSILRDSSGQIKLSFPVRGHVSAPGVSYRKLLYKSLEDLLLSAVSSPFSLIASIYDFSSEELSHIDFAPESYALLDDQKTKIELIRRALTERPALRLEIRGGSSIAADDGDPNDTVLDEKLLELAADRASTIRDSILANSSILPERIYMLAPMATTLSAEKTIPSLLALRSN